MPSLANSSCESGANVTCTWTSGSSRGTCAKSGNGASLPGNRYGTYAITCTATDAAGNVSAPVAFSVTVLQPLTIQYPAAALGRQQHRQQCRQARVHRAEQGAALRVRHQRHDDGVGDRQARDDLRGERRRRLHPQTITSCTDTPDSGGVMKLDGSNYRYNLSTKGLSATAGIPAFYQENFTVAYKSAPHVVVGTDTVQLDIK